MSNKKIVEAYMDGFNASDHARILSCLTEDIVWEMPGFFYLVGKDQFDGEIENDAFVGSPSITLTRLVEEGNVVVALGESSRSNEKRRTIRRDVLRRFSL